MKFEIDLDEALVRKAVDRELRRMFGEADRVYQHDADSGGTGRAPGLFIRGEIA